MLLLFGWSIAFFYHLCNGIRHLAWDAGYSFELPDAYRSGYAVLAATALLTVLQGIPVNVCATIATAVVVSPTATSTRQVTGSQLSLRSRGDVIVGGIEQDRCQEQRQRQFRLENDAWRAGYGTPARFPQAPIGLDKARRCALPAAKVAPRRAKCR